MLNLENQRVAVTGASSMLGRAVIKALIERNAIVDPIFHSETDLLFENETYQRFEKFRPDVVFHLAAWNGGIQYNLQMPATIFYRTTQMALNVVNACASFKVKKLVNILTSCSYPSTSEKLTENMYLSGLPHHTVQCHAFAKRNLFLHSQYAHKQSGLKSISVVFNNCYGPYDCFHEAGKLKVCGALIKKFVDAKRNGKESVEIFGSGKPRRELLFSLDAGEGAVRACEKYNDTEEVLNIGNGIDFTITELAEKIKYLTNYKGNLVYDTSKSDGQMRKILDVNKMERILEWYPPTSLEDGLIKTIEHYNNLPLQNINQESDR